MSSRSCFKSVRASGYFLIDVELNRGERFTVLALLLLAEPDAADVIAERTRGPRQALVRRNSEEVINIEELVYPCADALNLVRTAGMAASSSDDLRLHPGLN
jgi:hypothetical protein